MKTKKTRWGLTLALIFFILIMVTAFPSLVGLGEGFNNQKNFSSPNTDKNFQPPQSQPQGDSGYFSHDQLLKLILLITFSVLSLGIILFGKNYLRRYLLIAAVLVLGIYMGGYLCPISAVQQVFLKANTGYLLLFLVPVLLALLLGRVFCGYICPFGAMQELLNVRKWQVKIPDRWLKIISKIKYVLLIYLVVRVLGTRDVILQGYSPFTPLFEWGGTPLTIVLTILFAALSVFIYRPFCRIFCPFGAFLGLLSRFSLFKIKASSECCTCGLCSRKCPTGAIQNGTVDPTECLVCKECMESCPKEYLQIRGPKTLNST